MKRSMWFFGLLLAVAGLSSFRTADIAVSRPDRAQRRSLAKLERSYEYIRKMYVDSVDMAPLVEEAIRSMVQQLDPHTEYASAAEMAEFWSLYRGKFGGIGIQTQWIRDSLVVTSLLSGGAAEEAGIRPDDRIVRVDGRTVKEIPASELISVMRGDAGSKVKILVIRRGVCQPILYEIVRWEIPLPSVELAYRVDSAVGYIKLIRFGQTTMREVQRAYEELDRPKELILDLRGNGGGLLDQAIALSGFFLPKGSRIVSTEGRSVPSVVHSARRNPVFPAEGRLIVLIDERSASASEIVSGALQDWDRAVIVGRRSFGKGLVQRQYLLPDGSALRLVVARYHTPSGREIQRPYVKGGDRTAYRTHPLPDTIPSPAYRTLRTGRTVYGGGGIAPDVCVIQDTVQASYLNALLRKNIFPEFMQRYLDRNRTALERDYPEFASFEERFEVPDEMYEELIGLGLEQGVTPPAEDSDVEAGTRRLLKALLAERLFDREALLRILHARDDADFIRALNLLKNWEAEGLPLLEAQHERQ